MAPAPPLSDLVAALPLPTLAIDSDERIAAINPEASSLLGPNAEGRHFVTVLRQPALVEAVEQTLSDQRPRSARYLTGDVGKEQTYQVTIRAVAEPLMLLVSFQDITLEAQAGQMRRDFVANVSHELRTPLTALMGFIETLSGPAKDDAAARARFLSIMADEAGRMNRLVADLLSLSRVEAEARVRPKTEVDVTGPLKTALRNLGPLAAENEVALSPTLPAEPSVVRGDADQLLQVFTNLLENAIKYGGRDQQVDITLMTEQHNSQMRGPAVRISIRDHGPGIAPEALPRLTERFFRGDKHRSRALGGTGLGLAIVKHIINRHRGRLRIESAVGQGATFTVLLPLERGNMAENS